MKTIVPNPNPNHMEMPGGGGGGYSKNVWVGVCRWDSKKLSDSPLEYRARSVFCVLLHGFSGKRETAHSLGSILFNRERILSFESNEFRLYRTQCFRELKR